MHKTLYSNANTWSSARARAESTSNLIIGSAATHASSTGRHTAAPRAIARPDSLLNEEFSTLPLGADSTNDRLAARLLRPRRVERPHQGASNVPPATIHDKRSGAHGAVNDSGTSSPELPTNGATRIRTAAAYHAAAAATSGNGASHQHDAATSEVARRQATSAAAPVVAPAMNKASCLRALEGLAASAGGWGVGGAGGVGAGSRGRHSSHTANAVATGHEMNQVLAALTWHCSSSSSTSSGSSDISSCSPASDTSGSSGARSAGSAYGSGSSSATGSLTLPELVRLTKQLLRLRPALGSGPRRGQGERETEAALSGLLEAIAEAGARHLRPARPPLSERMDSTEVGGTAGPWPVAHCAGREQARPFRSGAVLLHNLAKLGDGGRSSGGRSSGGVRLAEALAAHAVASAAEQRSPPHQHCQPQPHIPQPQHQLPSQSLPAVGALEPRELQDLVWALGKVVGSVAASGGAAGALHALVAAMVARLAEPGLLGGMAPVGLSMVVYGMGKMGLPYSDTAVRRAVCEAVAGAARGGGCSPQALANMTWGLSRSLPQRAPRGAASLPLSLLGVGTAVTAAAVAVAAPSATGPNRGAQAVSGTTLQRRPMRLELQPQLQPQPPSAAPVSAAPLLQGTHVVAGGAGHAVGAGAAAAAAADAAQAAAVEALVAAAEPQLRAFKTRELANLLGGLTALGAFAGISDGGGVSASAAGPAAADPAGPGASAAARRLLAASRQHVSARLYDLGPQDVAELLYVYGSVYGSAAEDEPEEEGIDLLAAGAGGGSGVAATAEEGAVGGEAAGARLWPLLGALEERCLELLGGGAGGGRDRQQQQQHMYMRGYALGTCLWAFARLRYPAQRLVGAVAAGLAAGDEGAAAPAFVADLQLLPAATGNSSVPAADMPPQQLARFAWALARLSLSADGRGGSAAVAGQQRASVPVALPAAALQRLCDAVAARLPQYDTQSLLMATWALAVLGGGRAAGAAAALDTAAGRLASLLVQAPLPQSVAAASGGAAAAAALRPRQLAMALWSVARLMDSGSGAGGEGAGMACLRLFNGSRGALLAALPHLGPQGVAMLAWAYATAQLNPGDGALAALWERAAVLAPGLSGRGLAMVGAAMAHFRCRHARLTRALLATAAARMSAAEAAEAAAAAGGVSIGRSGYGSRSSGNGSDRGAQPSLSPPGQQRDTQPDDEAVWLPSVVCSLGRLGVTDSAFLQLVCARMPHLLPPPAKDRRGQLHQQPAQVQVQVQAQAQAQAQQRRVAPGHLRRHLAAAEAVPLLWGLAAMARGPPPSPAPAAAPPAAHGMPPGHAEALLPRQAASGPHAGSGGGHHTGGAVLPPDVVEGLAAVVEAAIRADAGCATTSTDTNRSGDNPEQQRQQQSQRQRQLDGGLLSMFLSACVEHRHRPSPAVLQAACALLLPLAPGLASHTLCELAWAVTMLTPPVRPGTRVSGVSGSGAADLGAHAMLPLGPRTRPSDATVPVEGTASAEEKLDRQEAEQAPAWAEELALLGDAGQLQALPQSLQQQEQPEQQATGREASGQGDELWAAVARLLRRATRGAKRTHIAAAAAAEATAAGRVAVLTPEDVARLGAVEAGGARTGGSVATGGVRRGVRVRVRATRRVPTASSDAVAASAVVQPASRSPASALLVRLPQRRYVPAAAAGQRRQLARAAEGDESAAGGDLMSDAAATAAATAAAALVGHEISAADVAAALASAPLPPMPPLPLQLWPLRLPPGERLFRLRPRAELLQRATVRTAAVAAVAAAARRQASRDAAAEAAAAAASSKRVASSKSGSKPAGVGTGAAAAPVPPAAPPPLAAAVAPIYPPRQQAGLEAAGGQELLRRCLALLSRRLCVERTEVLTLESLVRAAWAMCVARMYTPRLFRYAAARLLGLRSTAPLEGRPALLRALVEVRALVARQRPSTWRRLRLSRRWRKGQEAGARWRLAPAEVLAAQPAGMVRQLLRAQASLEAAAEARELPVMWRGSFAGDRHAVMQLGRRAAFAIVLVAPWHEVAAATTASGPRDAAAASTGGRAAAARGATARAAARGEVGAGGSAVAASPPPVPAAVPAPLAAGSVPVRLLRLRGWLVAALRVEPWLALPAAAREEQMAALYGRMMEAARQRGEQLRAAATVAAAAGGTVGAAKTVQKGAGGGGAAKKQPRKRDKK